MKKVGKYALNALLGLIMCVPVVTIAASITAMHFVDFKLCGNEDVNVCKEFFKSFRQNFKQSLVFLVFLLVIGGAIGYSWFSMFTAEGDLNMLVAGALLIATLFFLDLETISTYLLAKFENNTKTLLMLSLFAGIKNLEAMIKCAVVEGAMIALPILIVCVNPNAVSLTVGVLVFLVLFLVYQIVSAKTVNPIFEELINRQNEAMAKKEEPDTECEASGDIIEEKEEEK